MAVFDAPGADPCVSGSHWGWPDTKSAFGRTQTLAVQAPGPLAVGPRPAKRGCRSGRRGRAWERPPSLGCLYRHRGGPTWTTAMPPSTGVSPTPSVLCSKAVEPGGAAEHVRHALTETDMPDGWFTPGPSPSARGAGASFLTPALGVTILRVVFQMRRSAAGDARPSTRHLKTEEGLVKQSVSIIGDAKIVGTVTVGGLPVRDATVRAEGPLPVGSDQEPLKWGTRVDADGTFRIPVPPGTYTVKVPSSPTHVYAFGRKNVSVRFDESVEVHLRGELKPPGHSQQKGPE